MGRQSIVAPLLGTDISSTNYHIYVKKNWSRKALCFFLASVTIITTVGLLTFGAHFTCWVLRGGKNYSERIEVNKAEIVESEQGVVAADDARCSEIGASMLRQGGHAVDAAVSTALCVGVVNPVGSGIGGGAFMIVRSSSTSKTQAYDMRETAPGAASQNMYANNLNNKYSGALSMGVPGEIAGLHEAWLQHGRLNWRTLFQPAIKLARDGFVVAPYLASSIAKCAKKIMNDPGLQQVFAPNGRLLQAGDKCFNLELAQSLEAVAEQGPQAFYNGTVGEKLVKDVRDAGGILTMEDLKNYKVDIMDALAANFTGYTIYGMPPPSSGTLGMSLVLNILNSYGSSKAAVGNLGLHRLIEAMKHMFAVRMNLGDPAFVNTAKYMSEMLSQSYAGKIQKMIVDNTTFPPEYYMNMESRWSQLRDHGTSHFCVVDAERNAVSMTTTINYGFGAGVLSPSTGILLNNEMGDFSAPTEITPDMLPPAPANFIEPNKRPLSSMTPVIITKDDQLAGVMGGSGGLFIIPAVIQVFLNHFVLGMEPLTAVESPRVYHKLIPNTVLYENWTVIDGKHIELAGDRKAFLEERGHQLLAQAGGAIVQLVVQTLQSPIHVDSENSRDSVNAQILHGTLTAVSDPRKDGRPAAI
ncbi:PREDICTED: gamma-glutamyltranspeptidase 3-like isoform X1 [Populus euphratica]|uniref:Glutathione hydrolase n=1 Tax=Populus euphratica TaxID=75702 RepID=A0AAJ6X5G0_POPEU|nr:PREDICTED: gamma-glutamyltranspeptidase 3-like isoform X1 [Populus euphratica]XP_011006433.1 PREDICTED: gamma-glutamyltranspeptidase 3-like isoform X1 [Populus euphratica]